MATITMTSPAHAVSASPDVPAERQTTTMGRSERWTRLVRILTDPREARAELHRLDLGAMRSTWT